MSRLALPLVLSVALVVAGCSGPLGVDGTATPTPDATPTTPPPTATEEPTPADPSSAPPKVTVRGGTLPFNATEVWYRFLDLRGFDRDQFTPPVINISSARTGEIMVMPGTGHVGLAKRFGIGPVEVTPEKPGGVADGGSIRLFPRNGTAEEIEQTLVHEFEHYVQPRVIPTPLKFVVGEGAATFVEVAYAERYLESLSPVAHRKTRYVNATGALKFNAAEYYFGYQYVDRRIDSPKDLAVIYDDPPETTAQLLHGHDWDVERPLAVEASDGWRQGPRPAGELFLRVALATELSESTAAQAAAGWANDTVVEPATWTDDPTGLVWVIRTTDERNATELETAFEKYLDAKATEDGGVWHAGETTYRLVRVDASTLAIVVGDEAFVDDATVSTTNGTVVIAREGE